MRSEADLRSALRTLEQETPDAEEILRHVTGAAGVSLAHGRRQAPGRWPHDRHLLACAGAAAAIAVIVVVSLMAAHLAGGPRPDEKMRPQNVPGYYLDVGPANSKPSGVYLAVVRVTATGKAVATIRPPRPYAGFRYVTGAADDRTFVVTAQTTNGGSNASTVGQLYLVRFNPRDHAVSMSALPIPAIKIGLQALTTALSPDGTELAVDIGSTLLQQKPSTRLTLYSVASGAVLGIWRATGQLGIDNMRWARGGILGFNWSGQDRQVRDGGHFRTIPDPADGLRLLNTTAGSGGLLADSRHAYCDGGGGTGFLTPSPGPSPSKYSIYAIAPVAPTMEKFSAATGKAIGVIYRSPSRSTQPAYWVAWSNPDGSVLVIDAPIRTALHAPSRFGVVRNGRFTPLPGTRSLIPEFNTLAF
jgi:hypothetical protein